MLIPGVVWQRDERTSFRNDVVYFGYPKDFFQLKPCGDKPRKKHMNLECEINFIIDTVRTMCTYVGVMELFSSLIYVSLSEERVKSDRIGFLPSAFRLGGIKMCPLENIVSMLEDFSNKRSAVLVKHGNMSRHFANFKGEIVALMSNEKIVPTHEHFLKECNKWYPIPECPESPILPIIPSSEDLLRRCGRVTPDIMGNVVQVLSDSGVNIQENADGEALVDMESVSDAGKRKLDEILPHPTDHLDQDEDLFLHESSSEHLSFEKRQCTVAMDPEEPDFDKTLVLSEDGKFANLQKMSASSFIAFGKATEQLEAHLAEVTPLSSQLNMIKTEMSLLTEKESAHNAAVAAFHGSFNPSSLQEMTAKLAKLAEDESSIQEGKAKLMVLSVEVDKLTAKLGVAEKRTAELRMMQQDACKAIVSCSNEIQKMMN